MESIDDVKIKYAYTYIDCKLYEKHLNMTEEDREDIKQFCMRKLVLKWSKYNPKRGAWKTYMVTVLKSALSDALKWHWRNHWRMQFEELGSEAYEIESNEMNLYDMLEDDILVEIARKSLAGISHRTIMKSLNLNKKQYDIKLNEIKRILNE